MEDTTAAKHLAAHTSNASAQSAALHITALRGSVLGNPWVHDEPFVQVYTAKTRLPSARKAVKRAMSEAQMLHVLDVDSRPDVIVSMVRNSLPTRAVLDVIVDKDLLDVTEKTVFANRYGEKRDPMSVRDALVRWGAQLPADWLSSLTRAQAGRLQLWQLLRSDNLNAADVLDALNTYDSWGSKYDAPLLQWVLVRHEEVIDQLAAAPVASSAVQMTLAGSHLFGLLTADQQASVLDLDQLTATMPADRARLGGDWFEQHKFAWMAAGSNPTTHREVVERLAEPLDQTTEQYAARTISKRLSYFWRVDSFAEATDPVHRSNLVQHVVLGGKKANGRPHSLPGLVANPTLTQEEAVTIGRHLLHHSGVVPSGWIHPLVRDALAALETKFDMGSISTYENPLTKWWDSVAAAAAAPVGEERLADEDELAALERDVDIPVNRIDWEYAALTRFWLERAVGDNEAAWLVLYQLLPTFTGTVREFATVVTAMA